MTDVGDIHRADLNEEQRRLVLVLSNRRFHQLSARAIVAPQLTIEPDEVPFPWRVEIDGAVFAVDFVRALPLERLLERVDRAPVQTMTAVRRTLLSIT